MFRRDQAVLQEWVRRSEVRWGAKLFGTDVDKTQLLGLYSDALILSGVGKDYDDKTVKNMLGLLGDDFTSIGTIGCITAEEYEQEVVEKFKYVRSAADDVDNIIQGVPNFILKGKVRLARQLCVCNCTLANDPPTSTSAQAPTQSQPAFPPNIVNPQDTIDLLSEQVSQMISLAQNAQSATVKVAQAAAQKSKTTTDTTVLKRRLKLKELVGQINEDECEPLSDVEIAACFARFEVLMGQDEVPPTGEEPTEEQLSAISFLLKSGLNPYADFGIFGPYGHRIMKKVRLLGSRMNAQQQWQRIELYGPANYSMWVSSWNIYMNSLLMLDAVDLGKLTAYKRRQDYYHETYGESIWALQYQADVRTRTEQFVRVKRELLAQYNKDWQSALTQADNDEDKATVIFKTMKNPYVPTRP